MVIAQSVWNMSRVLLLILFYDKSNTVFGVVTLDQLKTVCVYGFPSDFTHDYIPPKDVCSAMGIYSTIKAPAGIDLSTLKQGLPYVYVFYTQCTNFTLDNHTVRFLDESKFKLSFLKTVIQEQSVDVLVLNFVEKITQPGAIPLTVDRFIVSVYQDLKAFKKDLLIGLMLPNSSPNELMSRLKDMLGDLNSLFVIETFDDVGCEYYEDGFQISPLEYADHFEEVMRFYSDLGFPSFQCFLTIDVFVSHWKNRDKNEDWTNSQMCESKSDSQSSYCTQTLADLYSQVSTIRPHGRFPPYAGVFINWADFDDWKDACQCGKFPALRVIDSAIKRIPIDDTLIGCGTYGQYS